jgi:hypothetical protein
MHNAMRHLLPLVLLLPPATAQAPDATTAQRNAAKTVRRWDDGGDLDKIVWHRPFAKAQELARESGRVLLIKPILGGGNRPKPGGVPCGGKNDCEGSW